MSEHGGSTPDGRASEALRGEIRGEIVVPDEAGYDDARRAFNALVDRRPAVVARCADPADVVTAMLFARDHGLPVGVRGGGGGVAGHGLVDGGLVIDLGALSSVTVDPRRRRASVGGGATWGDLDRASQEHGLAVTGATSASVGIAGTTLGGGLGFLLGTCGLSCDNLVGAQLVTATGGLLEVTAKSDAELLWALRGGGGNFGVVTRLDFRLHEVGPLYGGEVVVPLDDGAILRRYAEAQVWAPDGLITIAYVAHNAELGTAVSIQLAWLGTPHAGRDLSAMILGESPRLAGSLGPVTYLELQAQAGSLPRGLRHHWRSAFVSDLGAPVVDAIVELVRNRPPGLSGVLIEPIHGQARRYGFEHAAFPQRIAHFHVSGLGIWEDAAQDDGEIAWVRYAHTRIRGLGVGGIYVNHVTPDEPANLARTAYPPPVYNRLRQIKQRVDPDNVFRSNVNIPPAG